jgi:hypothetical protein
MNWPLFNAGTTESWREGRKLVDHSLRPGAVMTYGRMMQQKTHEFLTQLLASPKDFRTHLKLSVGGLPFIFICLLNDRTAFREKTSCHSLMATT